MPDTATTRLPTREQMCNALRALAMDAAQAQERLAQEGLPVCVVSMPSTMVFDHQDAAYKTGALPVGQPWVAIEAGVTDFWWKYVRASGAVLGVNRFGESAPAADVCRHFVLTVDNLVATVQAVLSRESKS